jgi:type I restriction enzyme S subunit
VIAERSGSKEIDRERIGASATRAKDFVENEKDGVDASDRRWSRVYPAYKDSGVEWLGRIPTHWELWRLKHVSGGLTVGVVVNPSQFVSPSGVAFLRGVDIIEGRIVTDNIQFMSEAANRLHSKSTLREGDLVSIRVGYPGVTAIVPSELDGSNCASLLITRRSHRIMSELLCYLMNSAVGKAQFKMLQDGAAQEQINVSDAVNFLVPLPPIKEQQEIVTFLDREAGRIDALLAKKERLIELLQEKRAALITCAVTKGLDPKVPMKESGVEWLGEIPAHWELKRLRHLSPDLGVGVVLNPSQYVVPDGVPFLYGSDVREGRIQVEQSRRISAQDSNRLPKSQLHSGDLVMVRVGAPGITAVVPPELDGANCASMLVIRRSPQFASSWLCYALNSRHVRSQVEVVQYGAAQEQFNVSHAANFEVAVPPLSEQQRIAAFLDSQTSELDSMIAKIRFATDRLREFRTALISTAVTGKIDVREEDIT